MKNGLFGGDYLDELDKKILSNRILWFIVFVFLGLLMFLMFSFNSLSNRVSVNVSMPPYVNQKKIKVGKDFANDQYFLLWGTYYASYIKDFNSRNIKQKLESLIAHMLPKVYMKHEADFKKLVKNTVNNKLVFHLNDIRSQIKMSKDSSSAYYILSGIGHKSIANKEQPLKECSIKIGMNLIGSEVYVSSIVTDCI